MSRLSLLELPPPRDAAEWRHMQRLERRDRWRWAFARMWSWFRRGAGGLS